MALLKDILKGVGQFTQGAAQAVPGTVQRANQYELQARNLANKEKANELQAKNIEGINKNRKQQGELASIKLTMQALSSPNKSLQKFVIDKQVASGDMSKDFGDMVLKSSDEARAEAQRRFGDGDISADDIIFMRQQNMEALIPVFTDLENAKSARSLQSAQTAQIRTQTKGLQQVQSILGGGAQRQPQASRIPSLSAALPGGGPSTQQPTTQPPQATLPPSVAFNQINKTNIGSERQNLINENKALGSQRQQLLQTGSKVGQEIAKIHNVTIKNNMTRIKNLTDQAGAITAKDKVVKGKKNINTLLKRVKDLFVSLEKKEALPRPDRTGFQGFNIALASSGAGRVATKFSPLSNVASRENLQLFNAVDTIRPSLIQGIRQATDMGARGLDSEKELEFYIQAATDVRTSFATNAAAMQILSDLYGTGEKLDFGVDVSTEMGALRQSASNEGIRPSTGKTDADAVDTFMNRK